VDLAIRRSQITFLRKLGVTEFEEGWGWGQEGWGDFRIGKNCKCLGRERKTIRTQQLERNN
jgi:hypothetical protein